MKILAILFVFCDLVSAIPTSKEISRPQKNAGCDALVILDAKTNVFLNYTLHPHSTWRNMVSGAAVKIGNPDLKEQALRAAEQGTFAWIEKPEDIAPLEGLLKVVPCDQIFGLVLAGLPFKKCPSVGIPPTNDSWSYEDLFVKPIVRAIKKYPSVAFAVIVEPGVIGEVVTNLDLSSCEPVRRLWRQNVPLALKGLELPNVVTYMDAAHGGWLGWRDNQRAGAKEIVNAWESAGELKQFRGIAINVASYNSWDMSPGEMFEGENTCYDIENPARNEQQYLKLLQKRISELNVDMPLYGIMDTSRSGVQGIRRNWHDWCNVAFAGFGRRFSSDTKDDNLDAFAWIKNGGISDGTSDVNSHTFDSNCGGNTAFKSMPEKGKFSDEYFEMLLKNTRPHEYSERAEVRPRELVGTQVCGRLSSRSFLSNL